MSSNNFKVHDVLTCTCENPCVLSSMDGNQNQKCVTCKKVLMKHGNRHSIENDSSQTFLRNIFCCGSRRRSETYDEIDF